MGSTNEFLDAVGKKLECKSDADLARKLYLSPPVISKLRNNKMSVGATLLINTHEETGFSIAELKKLAGITKVTAE